MGMTGDSMFVIVAEDTGIHSPADLPRIGATAVESAGRLRVDQLRDVALDRGEPAPWLVDEGIADIRLRV